MKTGTAELLDRINDKYCRAIKMTPREAWNEKDYDSYLKAQIMNKAIKRRSIPNNLRYKPWNGPDTIPECAWI